ncbi:MAG: hypothetical protein ACR2FY_16975 [Pirellulaceae bacterium]
MSGGTVRGFSKPAIYLDQRFNTLRHQQREAVTFSRQPAYDALWEAWQPCKVANWDGEGAEAIEQVTYQNAYRLIEALPSGFPSPTVTAEPDGHISLEWYRHPRQILTVSISPEGTLYWAALVGSEDPRGSCRLFDEFPETLRHWIARVCRG